MFERITRIAELVVRIVVEVVIVWTLLYMLGIR